MTALAAVEFRNVLSGLAFNSGLAGKRLLTRMDVLDRAESFQFITDAWPEVMDPFLTAAEELSVAWYAEQPAKPVPRGGKVFAPAPVGLLERDRLAANGRWALTQLDVEAALSGSATRAVFDQSRATIVGNATREDVRFARYASFTACGFCRLLATRGAVYHTEENALAGHDFCKCLAEPVRDDNYEPMPYVEQWMDDYESACKSGASSLGEIARAMESGHLPE